MSGQAHGSKQTRAGHYVMARMWHELKENVGRC